MATSPFRSNVAFAADAADVELPVSNPQLPEVLVLTAAIFMPFIITAISLAFPLRTERNGSFRDHWSFAVCIVPLCGSVVGIYTLLWIEVFFSTPVTRRRWLMAVPLPASLAFYGVMWAICGSIVPFGIEGVLVFVCLFMALLTEIFLPREAKEDGIWSKLAVSMTVLIGSALCIPILCLFEYASQRGAETAYLLIVILPVIFTRLTTDIQEAIPYTSADFAIIAQALVSWIFSLSTYFIIIRMSASANLWALYFVHLCSDFACVACVGPIWALWSNVGYLKTSKYHQTIFGWSQKPLKPRPIFVKYTARAAAVFSFIALISICYRSPNASAFNFVREGAIDSSVLGQMWACSIVEVLTSLCWIAFTYRLIKRRCSSAAFAHTIWHMAKNIVLTSVGGVVVTLFSFYSRCEEAYSLF